MNLPILAAIALFAFAPLAHAGERCQPPDHMGQVLCEVGIPSERLEPITSQQAMSQWCWAASISMIFGYHGHGLPQERIVQSVFGQLVDLPAMNGMVMTRSLARPWIDTRGRRFQAKVRVFDMQAGQFGLDTASMIQELREERPMLVGTVGHAMVMTALRYLRSPWGQVQVVGVTVRDPWPGRGRRDLQWHEMQPQYVAAVDLGTKKTTPKVGAKTNTSDTPDTVDTPEMVDANAACERACGEQIHMCIAAIPSHDVCLAQAVEQCAASCVYEFGNPPAFCAQACHPQANPGWLGACEARRAQAQAVCRASCTCNP